MAGAALVYALRIVLICLYTIFWGAAASLAAIFDRSGDFGLFAGRCWVRWILATCRIQVDARGLDSLSPGRPYVVMSNHQSHFDICALAATLPLSWRFVAKRELARIPFFGWGLVAAGHIVIDRGDHDAAVSSMKRAVERVRGGMSVIVFPEGTRSRSGALQPFKSGGFHLAIESGVPIVPATVSGSRRIAPPGTLRVASGRIRVTYGAPIPTAGLGVGDRESLKQQVRDAIAAGYDPTLQS